MELEVSPRVQRVLNNLAKKDYNQKELTAIYNNTVNDEKVSEEEREIVIEAVSQKIKSTLPRLAKKMFGPKDTFGREYLQRLYDILVSEGYDFSNNRVKAGVKIGHDMIAGKAYVALYFSYKNQEKWHAGVAFRQDSVDEDPKLIIAIYQGSESNSVGKERVEFDIADEVKALEMYRSYLDRIIN